MKKILAAVDGSAPSVHAARMGLQIAKATGATLTLIYVRQPAIIPVTPTMMPLTPFPGLLEAEEAAAAAVLHKVALELDQPRLPQVHRFGPPGETIADFAAEAGFDLVVVGNKGRGAVSRMLVGSTADRLVHVCPVPVMVVR